MSMRVVALDASMLARPAIEIARARSAAYVVVVHHGVIIGTFAVEEAALEADPASPVRAS